jgi:hypothetical protein
LYPAVAFAMLQHSFLFLPLHDNIKGKKNAIRDSLILGFEKPEAENTAVGLLHARDHSFQ